ncbi:MAG TPA: hypothetical protein VM032_00170 [Vicinamibacterales bacterium]|nr:hypothetical protein [Vicinamibacterales bacterium]
MSPILVRPVREQLEHDRIIRLLHGKSRRKYDAAMNPGAEQNAPVGTGPAAVFPDLVLHSSERGRRLEVVVEVETGESVNHLEALAEWANFARLRAAFHLYVPAGMVDVARRLCEDNHIPVTEVWSFHSVGDDVRFALIHRSKEAPVLAPKRVSPAEAPANKKVSVARVAKRAAAKRSDGGRKPPAKAKRPASRTAKPLDSRRTPGPARKKAVSSAKRKS